MMMLVLDLVRSYCGRQESIWQNWRRRICDVGGYYWLPTSHTTHWTSWL